MQKDKPNICSVLKYPSDKLTNFKTDPKHVRHEFFHRRRIANKLTQRVRTDFSYKRLSCLYNEMKPNTRRIS